MTFEYKKREIEETSSRSRVTLFFWREETQNSFKNKPLQIKIKEKHTFL